MKKLRTITIIVAIAVLLSVWFPVTDAIYPAQMPSSAFAAGTNVPLTITNPLPKSTVVTLTGPTVITITVGAGQTVNKSIPKATYKYLYAGCLGKKTQGPLKLKGGSYTLLIKACKMATWSFMNLDSSHSYSLNLKGWMNYNISIPPGQTKTYQIVADVYDAKENWCGKSYDFRIKISGKKFWFIRGCS